MAKTPGLDDAYAMSSKDDVTELYREWAASYDAAFIDAQGYQLPQLVTHALVAMGGQGPVLDVGAGTGRVAEHLRTVGITPVDALDLSDEMLAVARTKAIYRDLFVADVTQDLTQLNTRYNSIVSAGTFTHGHVGMEGIYPLLDVAAQGVCFALSVNATHYTAKGFADGFAALCDVITDFSAKEVRIYDDRASADHRNDLALIVSFKKA